MPVAELGKIGRVHAVLIDVVATGQHAGHRVEFFQLLGLAAALHKMRWMPSDCISWQSFTPSMPKAHTLTAPTSRSTFGFSWRFCAKVLNRPTALACSRCRLAIATYPP